MTNPNMIVIGGVRYREEDARRLGFAGAKGVIPAPSDKPEDKTEPEDKPADEPKPPAKSASKGEWTEFALANGRTEEDLEGMTRDDIVAIFSE